MLHPITQEIAEVFGYVPFTDEDLEQQYQAEVNYDDSKGGLPRNGSVYRNKQGILRCYWKPKYGDKTLEGWYDIPTNEEIEEWSFDSVAFTPDDDEVEPDHPDSWLSILGLIWSIVQDYKLANTANVLAIYPIQHWLCQCKLTTPLR